MTLSSDDKARVRERIERMIVEYRAKPTSELEDQLGLEVAVLPAPEREYVPKLLLEIVAAEARPR